jgi:hypothetical protein
VPPLQVPGVRDGRFHLRQDQNRASSLVRCDLVRHQSEARGQRLGLQRVLGLGSYETAWTLLHRLRRAMVRPGRDLLHGEVEVDESYLALTDRKHPISAKSRQSNTTKAMVAIAVEVVPDGFGRIRIQRLDRGNQQSLQSFITETVAPGSKSIAMGLAPIARSKISGLTTRSLSIWVPTFRPTSPCQGSTGWRLYCSDG